jgi:hypothetical protein
MRVRTWHGGDHPEWSAKYIIATKWDNPMTYTLKKTGCPIFPPYVI